jgi:hypothetical protein
VETSHIYSHKNNNNFFNIFLRSCPFNPCAYLRREARLEEGWGRRWRQ